MVDLLLITLAICAVLVTVSLTTSAVQSAASHSYEVAVVRVDPAGH